MSKTFFGIQVVVKNFVSDPLRKELHEIIAGSDAEQSLVEKRAFWKRVTAVLNEALPAFEYGYWDLLRGGSAGGEFGAWSSGIEGRLATEEEGLGAAPDEINRLPPGESDKAGTLGFLGAV